MNLSKIFVGSKDVQYYLMEGTAYKDLLGGDETNDN
jgi:hypothetical protein